MVCVSVGVCVRGGEGAGGGVEEEVLHERISVEY